MCEREARQRNVRSEICRSLLGPSLRYLYFWANARRVTVGRQRRDRKRWNELETWKKQVDNSEDEKGSQAEKKERTN